MKKFFVKATSAAMTALLLSAGSFSALAAEDSYGYLAGQQQYESRHKVFSEASQMTNDSEREAFLAENETGGKGSDKIQLNTEDLITAGVIDEGTAERIAQYASKKQKNRHEIYAGKTSMTPEERHSFYVSMKEEPVDPVEELLNAGIITQEQANSITGYLQ